MNRVTRAGGFCFWTSGWTVTDRLLLLLLQVGDSLRQERPFNFVLGEREGFFIRREGFGNTPETPQEVGPGRGQVAVSRQLWLAFKRLESGEAGGGSRAKPTATALLRATTGEGHASSSRS